MNPEPDHHSPKLTRQPAQCTRFWSTLAAGAAAVAAATAVLAAPEPDPVPRRWQLEVDPGALRITTLPTGRAGEPVSYFYMTYRVVNQSGQDLLFAPAFELASDEGEVVRSGRDVPQEITKQVMASLENPLVRDQIDMVGPLLQGPENARQGLVIWRAGDIDPDEITVYAAGFSGETATVKAPAGTQTVVLRKTLSLTFSQPGTLIAQGSTPLSLANKRWIMR